MKLRRLKIQNFLGIGSANISFDHKGLTLIEGINHDSPSSISNGAGKSSVFEALFWILFGKTKRGLTGDDVVNRTAKKNCIVELMFDDYLIQRFRKHEKDGSGLRLYAGKEGSWDDITKGTMKETQFLIEDLTKLSELTFSKVAYFGQEDVKSFASLSDAELKSVFEQALGVTFLTEYVNKVKVHRVNVGNAIVDGTTKSASREREVEYVRQKIESLTKAMRELEAKRTAEVKRVQDEIDEAKAKHLEINKTATEIARGIEKRGSEVKAQLERRRHEQPMILPSGQPRLHEI